MYLESYLRPYSQGQNPVTLNYPKKNSRLAKKEAFMVAHIVIESVLMVFGITIAGYFIGKLFKEAEKED